MKEQRNSIGKTLMIGSILAVLLLCILMGMLGFLTYYHGTIVKYQTYLHDVLTFVMTEVEGDDLERCMETGTKSEAFERTQELLNRVKDTHGIEFIYIIKPLNTNPTDNIMNIMAGITSEERERDEEYYTVKMGVLTGDNYSPEVAALYLKGMESSEISYFRNETEYGYDYTGLVPIRNSKGDAVALLAVDISMEEIRSALLRYVAILVVEIVVLTALALYAIYQWLRKRVIQPLTRLKSTTESFVESSRTTNDPACLSFSDPQIHTGDEMQALSTSVSDMFTDMKRYMTDLVSVTAEKERIGAELNVAAQIQADMLPRVFPAFPDRREFEVYASMTPAKEVGGDFYDFFLIDDDHLALVMADVSGKGVPAALFMVVAKSLIKNQAPACGYSPARVLMNVNEQLCEGNEAELFVTVWLAILELSTGKGMAANAGHEHPTLRRAGGKYELVEYRHSPAVATMEGIRFREHEFELHPGDSLFVYTDGVAEATDAYNELYGTDRMLDALNEDPDAAPEAILSAVMRSVDNFVGEAPQFDDITMLCMKYNGKETDK
ncbi:MAG: phosphoserine phosphatase [Ruminococcaceae bacterium]|nr:phosphoserine phosphatase [Oscillospiraceae bacterium]